MDLNLQELDLDQTNRFYGEKYYWPSQNKLKRPKEDFLLSKHKFVILSTKWKGIKTIDKKIKRGEAGHSSSLLEKEIK